MNYSGASSGSGWAFDSFWEWIWSSWIDPNKEETPRGSREEWDRASREMPLPSVRNASEPDASLSEEMTVSPTPTTPAKPIPKPKPLPRAKETLPPPRVVQAPVDEVAAALIFFRSLPVRPAKPHLIHGGGEGFQAKDNQTLRGLAEIKSDADRGGPQDKDGPVQIPKGKIIGKRWRVTKKLGEGGCGAVYKVEDINNGTKAALKAESNFVAGGSVLKLEVQILRRLENRPHVAQLLHSGKREKYSYMVMTLLGDSLNQLIKKVGKQCTVSTQVRVGCNVLFGLKQIHDIGFVHRDIKPANLAIGRPESPDTHFIHILDFGLSREFVIQDSDGKLKMRRPRPKALFRGTTRYCSIATHEKVEQCRADDLWSLLYLLAEMRGPLPWANCREKKEVLAIKKQTTDKSLLSNCPIQLLEFAKHLRELTYYCRPNYALLQAVFLDVMQDGKFKFSDPFDWERKEDVALFGFSKSKETANKDNSGREDNPFPMEEFLTNPLGF